MGGWWGPVLGTKEASFDGHFPSCYHNEVLEALLPKKKESLVLQVHAVLTGSILLCAFHKTWVFLEDKSLFLFHFYLIVKLYVLQTLGRGSPIPTVFRESRKREIRESTERQRPAP